MSSFGNVKAVVKFELKRSTSRSRIGWWLLLAAFPVALTLIVKYLQTDVVLGDEAQQLWAGIFFVLCPMTTSMLGTFLIASPAISTELERKSWVYFSVRPYATNAVLLGKYFFAVIWAATAGILGVTISILLSSIVYPYQIWGTTVILIILSCFAYAAAYLLLGTIFYKRAMIAGIVYSLVFEIAVSLVPAIINKLTIQYRLRAIFINWSDIKFSSHDSTSDATLVEMFGQASSQVHIFILVVFTIALLGASMLILRFKEFTVADEATT